jgi:hypothetical protein
VGWFIQIVEGEVVDTALGLLAEGRRAWIGTHFSQKFLENYEEPHQITRIAGEDSIGIAATQVLRSSAHSGRNDLACRVHQQFRQPFEHFLDDLWVGFLKVGDTKVDANVCDTACNLCIRLFLLVHGFPQEKSLLWVHTSVMKASCSTAGARWLCEVARAVLMRGLYDMLVWLNCWRGLRVCRV